MASREKSYFRAVRRATAQLNSDKPTKEVLAAIVRGTAMAVKGGASLLMLDASGRKLVHTHSWGLPQFYIRKGLLDYEKGLAEVAKRRPVAIADVARDSHIQYPELALRAGFASILGVPVSPRGEAVGSLRVYSKERNEFSNQDISFVSTMANLAATALGCDRLQKEGETAQASSATPPDATLKCARPAAFAHPSEEEFARLLDFYKIEWFYEPQSFPLRWQEDRVTEMFTPDFYLPRLDLYIELTTLKQSLVTEKNRKLRRLKELYPKVNIILLYKKDFDRILGKYGLGPLAQTRAHGINRVLYSAAEIDARVRALAEAISRDYAGCRPILVGVQRGFLCFMADLLRHITVPLDIDIMAISYYGSEDGSGVRITRDMDLNASGRHVIFIEDIVDTGVTLNYLLNHLRGKGPASLSICTLLDRRQRRIADIPIRYVGFEVPDEFVVGYGLDYKEEYRNLPFIAVPVINEPGEDKI